jgi:hypothetical protein
VRPSLSSQTRCFDPASFLIGSHVHCSLVPLIDVFTRSHVEQQWLSTRRKHLTDCTTPSRQLTNSMRGCSTCSGSTMSKMNLPKILLLRWDGPAASQL